VRVVYACSIDRGGPLSHLRDLAPAVARLGVDVRVLAATETVAERFRADGVDAVARPLAHKLDAAGARAVWRELQGADVVHTHDRRSGLLVRPQARLRGVKAVHTLHGIPDEIFIRVGRDGRRPEWPGVSRARLAWLEHGVVPIEAALARLGTIVVPSHALADYLRAHRFPARRLRVIPNGISVRRTEPGPLRSPPVVGTAAILEHRKGVDVLLEAAALAGTPLRLEIFGEGADRPVLERRAAELGLDTTFHGFVEGLRSRIADLDVFVLPTRGENLPVSILEAMAEAVPVVSTRVGGIPELVEDGASGLLVEPDDAPALAMAIRRVVEDPELHARLGAAGAARAAERFDNADVAARMVALYEELCGSST
jgi:glycosyltransferase involved in cell wall biosynthesis